MVRKYLLIIGCVLGLFTSKTYSQATTIMSIDSVNILTPVLFGGTTDIEVQVRVMNGFVPDTLFGDIYYYYLTDTMDSLGIPPQIVDQDFVMENVADPFLDTVHIPINTGEMKTGPLNLIVVWPAMMNPEVLDTDSVAFYLQVEGYIGIEPLPSFEENILYPLPAMHYLFIKPHDIDLIEQIQIMNMQGQIINTMHKQDFSNGWLNIDQLPPGAYMVILQYKNGTVANKKILKE
jgi:hypothetical protein